MSAQTPTMTRAWMVVGLLWLVALLNYLDRNMVFTMRQSLREAIAMDDRQFGLLGTAFLWVYGFLSPVGGYLADRFGRSRVIIASVFVWSLVTWLTAHAQTYHQLLIARALMGLSEATYLPAALSLIADYHRGPTRSLATGVHMSGVMVGATLGALGGVLAERYAWTTPFNLFGALGMAYALVLWAVLRDTRAESEDHPCGGDPASISFVPILAALLGNAAFRRILIFWGIIGTIGWPLTAWLPTYLQETFHLSQGDAGSYATSGMFLPGFLGVMIGGHLSDRWSKTNPRARMHVAAIGMAVAAPALAIASSSPFLWLAIAGLCLMSLFRTYADSNMMPILCLICDPRHRATGYGVLNMLSCVAGGVAVYVGGYVRDQGVNVRWVFYFVAALFAVNALIMMTVKPLRTPPPSPESTP